MSYCEVITCNSKNEPGRTYHRFPNDPVRREEWMKIIGIKELKLKTQSAVCSRHFRAKDYWAGGKRLFPAAVPALKLHNNKKESKSGTTVVNQKSPVSGKNMAGPKKEQIKQASLELPTNKKHLNDEGLDDKLGKSHNKCNSERKEESRQRIPASSTNYKFSDKKLVQKSSPKLESHRKQNGGDRNITNTKSSLSQTIHTRNRSFNSTAVWEPKPTDESPYLKRKTHEDKTLSICKRAKVQVEKLVPNKINNGSKSNEMSSNSSKTPQPVVKDNISNIEQTIVEMQNKIEKLEQKSVLDEKKIETFKKALIEQREKDIKILMDEKENELLLRMDLLYLDYDPQRICRLCLLLVDKRESLISLFWPLRNQALIPLILNTTGIQVEMEDGMPSGICSDCLQQVRKVDWIRRRTQRSNILIKKFLVMKRDSAEGASAGLPSEKIQFGDDLFEEESMGAFKIEDVFSLENSSEETLFGDLELKQEPLDMIDINTSDSDERVFFRKWPTHVVKTCKKCRTTFTNLWSYKSHQDYCCGKFVCVECNKRFWNRRLLSRHRRARRACATASGHRSCYECQTVFRWKWQLLFHVLLHDYQPCRLCDAMFYSVQQLRCHVAVKHSSGYWTPNADICY